MHTLRLCLAATVLSGCAGISIGESGEEPEAIARCVPDGEAGIADLNAPIEGLEATPAEQVEDAETQLAGVLRLEGFRRIGIAFDLKVASSVHLVSTSDPDPECHPYLKADATLEVDAGASLRGVARGELYIREPLQFRGGWTPLDEFESDLPPPDFRGDLVEGPALIASVLREEDGRWIGSLQYAAHIATEPCDGQTRMCTGGPGNFTPDYRPLGELVDLRPVP